MTRRDYEAVAKGVREAAMVGRYPSTIEINRHVVAESLADVLALTNPHFDRARFLAACLGRG